jgi:HEAT repeat protein
VRIALVLAGAAALLSAQDRGAGPQPDRIRALAAALVDPDPAARKSAARALRRIGAPAAEQLLDLVDSPDAEVRRFVRAFVAGELRAGDPRLRRQLIEALARRGRGAVGFVPELESLGKRYSGELGYLARIASMRIAGTRQHVVRLLQREDAHELLREFDPDRFGALVETFGRTAQGTADYVEMNEYLHLLAAADPEADAFLAGRIAKSEQSTLPHWLAIAVKLPDWPGPVGAAMAGRLAKNEGPAVAAICRALLAGRGAVPAVVGPPVAGLVAREGADDVALVLVAVRCTGPGRAELRRQLRRLAEGDTPAAYAALCVLRTHGEKGLPAPERRLRDLGQWRRGRIIALLSLTGARECVPLFRDTLLHGSDDERRVLLAQVEQMPCARELLPALAEVTRRGPHADRGRAIEAIAAIDPELAWDGTERALLEALDAPILTLRSRAVYACDDLRRVTAAIAAALERRLQDENVAGAMAWVLPNTKRLGRRGKPLVGLLAAVARKGPPGPAWGGKSRLRWRRECLDALARIDADDGRARVAFREGLASADKGMRRTAMLGFRFMERPEPADVDAVRRVAGDTDKSLARAAGIVLSAWRPVAVGKDGG